MEEVFGTISSIDWGELTSKFFGAVTAIGLAVNGYMSWRAQATALANRKVSEGNAQILAGVAAIGNANAEAIEHTRVQNVKIASAVQDTKDQNDEIATAVSHVHICVETKAAELKEAVKEAVPAAIKEAVPAAIKEVVPDVIKETLPGVVATLKE